MFRLVNFSAEGSLAFDEPESDRDASYMKAMKETASGTSEKFSGMGDWPKMEKLEGDARKQAGIIKDAASGPGPEQSKGSNRKTAGEAAKAVKTAMEVAEKGGGEAKVQAKEGEKAAGGQLTKGVPATAEGSEKSIPAAEQAEERVQTAAEQAGEGMQESTARAMEALEESARQITAEGEEIIRSVQEAQSHKPYQPVAMVNQNLKAIAGVALGAAFLVLLLLRRRRKSAAGISED